MKLFLSPHNDDETLFGAFTIMRERPLVAVVFDSFVQLNRGAGVTGDDRRWETCAALQDLMCDDEGRPYPGDPPVSLKFLGFSDAAPDEAAIEAALRKFGEPEMVYAPAIEPDGHQQHNLIGALAAKVFPRVTHYLTYTRTGGKSRSANEVQPRSGDDIARKLRALACYTSQLQMDPRIGCWPHFMRDLSEYYV